MWSNVYTWGMDGLVRFLFFPITDTHNQMKNIYKLCEHFVGCENCVPAFYVSVLFGIYIVEQATN